MHHKHSNARFGQTIRRCLGLMALLGLAGCASTAPPEQTKTSTYTTETHDIPAGDCRVHARRLGDPERADGALFVAVNGVPTTSLIYQHLAEALTKRLAANVLMVDLPGTGGSRLHSGNYTWSSQRECLRAYLARQPDFTLVVHDVAGPILLPLLGELPQIRRVVVFNSLLTPSVFSPPFPLNCLRSCLFLSKPLAHAAPFWFYEYRLRDLGITYDERVDRSLIKALFDELHQDNGMSRLVDVMKGFELTQDADAAINKGIARDLPQLFIWGANDPVLGDALDKLAGDIPQREIHVLKRAKHYLMLDFADESAALIADWYRSHAR